MWGRCMCVKGKKATIYWASVGKTMTIPLSSPLHYWVRVLAYVTSRITILPSDNIKTTEKLKIRKGFIIKDPTPLTLKKNEM